MIINLLPPKLIRSFFTSSKTFVVITLSLLIVNSGCSNTTKQKVPSTAQPSTSISTIPVTSNPESGFTFHFNPTCWPTATLQKSSNIKGSLIFESSNSNAAFAWDISSFKTKPIRKNSGLRVPFDFPVSPDGSFLGDLPIDENKLILTSANQALTFTLPKAEYGIQYLLNGNILIPALINRDIHSENYKEGVGFTDEYEILDPTSGDVTADSLFLPNFILNSDEQFAINYSPDMHYVIYHSTLQNQPGREGFTLLDLTDKETKWKISESYKSVGEGDISLDMPVWKPDASGLTYIWLSNGVNKAENFYTISLDGEITQLTQFEQSFKPGYILFSQPQWSPDARFLGFKIEQYPATPQFYIWDDKEKTLFNTCLPVNIESGLLPFYNFIWSFDSKYIEVSLDYQTSSMPPRHDDYYDIILDLTNRTILTLQEKNDNGHYTSIYGKDNYGVLGWVNWEIP